jgi:hypothetical protein
MIDEVFLNRCWKRVKNQGVGKRYSPETNIELPLNSYFDASLKNDSYYENLRENIAECSSKAGGVRWQGLERLIPITKTRITRTNNNYGKLEKIIETICNEKAKDIDFESLIQKVKSIEDSLKIIWRAGLDAERNRSLEEHEKYTIENFNKYYYSIGSLYSFLSSSESSLFQKPYFYITGNAGAGKTHLICSVVEKRIIEKQPALVFLGQEFQKPFKNLVEELIRSLGLTMTKKEFLNEINKYAKDRNTRFLICIDAINEGHIESWRKGIPCLKKEISKYPNIALVISFRREHLRYFSDSLVGLKEVWHIGYPPEKQSEAIAKYFGANKINLPEVPLLQSEFSNPLFLKLFSEAIGKLSKKKKSESIKSISSGQKGMTFILEFFIDQKDKQIRKVLGTNPGTLWKIVKDGLAPEMARMNRNYVLKSKAIKLIDSFQPAGMVSGSLMKRMVAEDILSQDIIYGKKRVTHIIRFTYNRFSDNIIARSLYENSNLNSKSTPSEIKEILRSNQGIGYFFRKDKDLTPYLGIINALLIDFNERTGNRKELFHYLSWGKYPISLCEELIDSIYWRSTKNITPDTVRWLMGFLENKNLKDKTYELLLTLSFKDSHRINSLLPKKLNQMSLTDRDLSWSEFIRIREEDSSIERVITWASYLSTKRLTVSVASKYIIPLKWFLTSTDQFIRDKATHLIYKIGVKHPKLVFEETIRTLSVNDPYVSDRMLAASYGIIMANWQSGQKRIQKHIVEYAKKLYLNFFSPGAVSYTTHALSREYASSSIQLALQINNKFLTAKQIKLTQEPFGKGRHKKYPTSPDKDKGDYRNGDAPMQMDFENYTLGRLVPLRTNHDMTNQDYLNVKQQIFGRIYQLGYNLKQFSKADQEIGRARFYSRNQNSSAERYGKKYCKIAFFEIAGRRADNGLLEKDRFLGNEIDPSFPELERKMERMINFKIPDVPLSKYLNSNYKPGIRRGLVKRSIYGKRGPWIALEGFTTIKQIDKECFVFLRGFFVKEKNTKKAIEILHSLDYPGNRALPSIESDYGVFCGEIPWSKYWGKHYEQPWLETKKEKVEVELPCRELIRESESPENNFEGRLFLSQEMANQLNLRLRIPEVGFFDNNNRLAAILTLGGKDSFDGENMVFIRKDLLDHYLLDNKYSYIQMAWGERTPNYSVVDSEKFRGKIMADNVIHKQIYVYSNGKFISS